MYKLGWPAVYKIITSDQTSLSQETVAFIMQTSHCERAKEHNAFLNMCD